ncbi:S-adenosyl-L-methionine-dependent methyltransferases superfamily protein [Tanacetum coccineum]
MHVYWKENGARKMQHLFDGRAWKELCTESVLQHVAGDTDNIQSASVVMYEREFFNADVAMVSTIDVATGLKFNMRAMVLWTINDFPARSSLSGWSGQGYKACPTCNEDTPSVPNLLSNFDVYDMLKAQSKVIDILCNLELIYPPAFFDIMIHLVIHLPLEAIFGGPIRPRPEIDTYRAKFKSEFPNKDMKEEFPGLVWEADCQLMSHGVSAVRLEVMIVRSISCTPPAVGVAYATELRAPIPIWVAGERAGRIPAKRPGTSAAHWANYLVEALRELPFQLPFHAPNGRRRRKAGVVAKIGTQFDLRPHMESDRWPQIYAGIQQHLQKIYNGKKMETSATREYPSLIHTFFLTHTVGGVFLNPEDKALYDEMLRLQGLGSNTPTGVPYTEDEIMAIVRGGKQRGHIPGVGRVLPGQGTVIPPPSQSTHSTDIARLKKRE